MVNPLLILPLLNASALTTTSDGCYEQNPPGEPQLISTTFVVCNQAINNIANRRALDTPLDFGRTVKVGQTLPIRFFHKGFYNSCYIKLDMEDGRHDTLTWRDVIISASILRDYCVSVPPHLGGEAKAGRRKLLDIKMFGVEEEVGLVLPAGSSEPVQGRVFGA